MSGNGDTKELPEDWVLAELPLEAFLEGLKEADGVEERAEELASRPEEEIEERLRRRKGIQSLRSAGLDFAVRRAPGALRGTAVVVIVATAVAVALYRLGRRRRQHREDEGSL
jgi:hypothetical protein